MTVPPAIPSEPFVPTSDEIKRSQEMIAALRKRKLPQMVDWIQLVTLGMVGVRTVLSKTIGQYADQRPMQAAMDPPVDKTSLALRHDYSDPKKLNLDNEGSLWVDFIADLGDGFEPTYAMAYLMAATSLKIPGAGVPGDQLKGGDILILGGDLAYPNATVKEYQDRCIMPFNAAFQGGDQSPRKLFFIAGNHDWYDGLAAFTSVFCGARGSDDDGIKIGQWQSEQRRSYFALKLPHDWWIWGIDTGLSDGIDEAQIGYFRTVVREISKDASASGKIKIIVTTHTPAWTDRNDKSLAQIAKLVRNNANQTHGPEISLILAGDLHNYSRHVSDGSDRLHLITSGGGAFLHPTHNVKTSVGVSFVEGRSFSEAPLGAIKGKPFRAEAFYPSRGRSRWLACKNLFLPFHNRAFALFVGIFYLIFAWMFQTAIVDPSVSSERSRRVLNEQTCALRYPNAERKAPDDSGKLRGKCIADGRVKIQQTTPSVLDERLDRVEKLVEGINRPKPEAPIVAQPGDKAQQQAKTDENKWKVQQIIDEDLSAFHGRWVVRLVFQASPVIGPDYGLALEVANWVKDAKDGGGWSNLTTEVIWPRIAPKQVFYGMLANPAFFFMVVVLYLGLIAFVEPEYASAWVRWPAKLGLGILHAGTHLTVLLALNTALHWIVDLAVSPPQFVGLFIREDWQWLLWMVPGVITYCVLMTLIGGILGGFIFGLYWVITSLIGCMDSWAYGALGIGDYKNFLRMRFDKNGGLTTYSIHTCPFGSGDFMTLVRAGTGGRRRCRRPAAAWSWARS
jgi:Calcineurin-like phosphoesterase